MDIKSMKDLASQYTADQLEQFAKDLEEKGECPLKTKEDLGDLLSDLLQAREVRLLMDQGLSLNEAVREFSKRVRHVLS